jgi:pyruvate kinase
MVEELDSAEIVLFKRLEASKTTIIATIGPACYDPANGVDRLEDMVDSGMTIARINLSHLDFREQGDRKYFLDVVEKLREISKRKRTPVGILIDMSGPKIRLGKLKYDRDQDGIYLRTGDTLVLTREPGFGLSSGEGTRDRCSIKYAGNLAEDIGRSQKKTGRPQTITIDDGKIEVVVQEIRPPEIVTKVKHGGLLRHNKGLNIPGCELSIPYITQEDLEDLDFLVTPGEGRGRPIDDVDFIALSFVKRGRDIEAWRGGHLHPKNVSKKIIAKIETIEAADKNLEEIMECSDAIMVARGDLGAEKPFEDLPKVQGRLVQVANTRGVPVIIATQMLDSMRHQMRPTRAEVTDVSHAVIEGADAVMLSGETSVGVNPPNAVHAMGRIVRKAEARVSHRDFSDMPPLTLDDRHVVIEAIAHPIVELASRLDSRGIIVFTTTGETPKYIARYRPGVPVIAVTSSYEVVTDLLLHRGVYPALVNFRLREPEDKRRFAYRAIREFDNKVTPGDIYILVMGIHRDKDLEKEYSNTINILRYKEI